MVYSKHFVAAIKADNKILRETKTNDASTVHIPFGSEYSILLKNLSTQRAVVTVTIDGTDVLGGRALIVNPNDDFELERFVKDLAKGNKFRFIEKTAQISEFRGDKVDDGIVRIEYQFEKKPEPIQNTTGIWTISNYNPIYDGGLYSQNTVYRSSRVGDCVGSSFVGSKGLVDGNSIAPQSVNYCAEVETKTCGNLLRSINVLEDNWTPPKAQSEDGITVRGSASSQQFSRGSVGALEYEKHVITLQLRGKSGEELVIQPVTVKTKAVCKVCGSQFKTAPNFCPNCSAAMGAAI